MFLVILETRWLNYGKIKQLDKTIFYFRKMNWRHKNGKGFVVSEYILSNLRDLMASGVIKAHTQNWTTN